MQKYSQKSVLPTRVTGTVRAPKLARASAEARFDGYIDFLTADVRKALHLPSRPDPEPDIWTAEDVVEMQRYDPDQAVWEDPEIFKEITFEHDVGNSLWWAVREYITSCIDKVNLKEFRIGAAAGEKTAKELLAFLRHDPSDRAPTSRAIDQARIGRALTQGINRAKGEDDFEDMDADEAIAGLEFISRTLTKIRSAERGSGRDANRAAHQFIADLARIFEERTGQLPTRCNLADGSGVTGPFGRFVAAVDVQLPAPFQLPDLDNLIRQEVARQRTG
jgi:hypothetical protein